MFVQRRRPTIHDVAAVAGVSRGTVSRLLNGDKYVSTSALVCHRKFGLRPSGVPVRTAMRTVSSPSGIKKVSIRPASSPGADQPAPRTGLPPGGRRNNATATNACP